MPPSDQYARIHRVTGPSERAFRMNVFPKFPMNPGLGKGNRCWRGCRFVVSMGSRWMGVLAGCFWVLSGQVSAAEDAQLLARVQSELKELGFYSGDADGQMSEKLKAAIGRFQMRSGKEETGVLDEETLRLLQIAEQGAAAPNPQKSPESTAESTANTENKGNGVLPAAFPADRYREMLEHSPFAVATPAAVPVETAPGFATNLYVMGIAKMRYADGRESEYVTIKSRSDNTTFSLSGSEPNKEGIALVGVEWVDGLGKSKVNLKKGAEFGTLEFDQANVRAPSGGPQGISGAAVAPPQMPGAPRSAIRPSSNTQLGSPLPPSTRIPGSAKPGGLPTPGGGTIRQRIRPISSKP
jgi:hypothetical protein